MMRIRLTLGFMVISTLVACAPAIPDSGAGVDTGTGVGFGNYDSYQREKAAREAALTGRDQALPPAGAISSEPLDATGGATAAQDAADKTEVARIAAETDAALTETGAKDGPLQASPSNPPPAVVNAVGISRENSFDAVGAERSIQEDAARIARNRAQYKVIQPQAIGARPGDVGPNIVNYALSTRHPIGTRMYSRARVMTQSRHARNCAKYPSPDKAQLDFLRKGGPERDRLALDPDGDGYACGWDPTPFRRAVGN